MSTEPQPAASEPTEPVVLTVSLAWLTPPIHEQLVAEAERRGLHKDQLLAAIAVAALTKGNLAALLD